MPQQYNSSFYQSQQGGSLRSARIILTELVKHYPFQSVCDFGCGVGTWLAAAQELGVPDVCGFDGDYVNPDKLLIAKESFSPRNLSEFQPAEKRYDLAISLEVAEHLEQSAASNFVKSITLHSDLVLFSAATPYQGGTGHVNENWLEYWEMQFAAEGYEPVDFLRWKFWSNPDVEWWYRQNIVIFRKVGSGLLSEFEACQLKSVIHPEGLLRFVRRPPARFGTTLHKDIEYLSQLGEKDNSVSPPGYGVEFDWKPQDAPLIQSYADLKATPLWKLHPVLADAVGNIKHKLPEPLVISNDSIKPNFIGIGVQKSCTTWLYKILNSRQDVFLPPGKEINFFNRRYFQQGSAYNGFGYEQRMSQQAKNYFLNTNNISPKWAKLLTHIMNPEETYEWYSEVFRPYSEAAKLVGEITPEYAMLPASAYEEMLAINPSIKIILLLRHPVDRALSHLSMITSFAPESAAFVEQLAQENSVLNRGRYDEIISRVFSVFDKEQVFIGFEDEVRQKPEAFAQKLADFLEIDVNGFKVEQLTEQVFKGEGHIQPAKSMVSELCTYYEPTLQFMVDQYPEIGKVWRTTPYSGDL